MAVIPLNVYSSYSLLESSLSVSDIVQYAKKQGLKAIALTDKAVLHGAIDFYQACKKEDIKPLIGLTLQIKEDQAEESFPLVLLAKNYSGYRDLMALSSKQMMAEADSLSLDDLKASQDLIAISQISNKEDWLDSLAKKFEGHFYVGLREGQTYSGGYPIVALNPVRFASPEDFSSYQVVRAIYHGCQLEDLDEELDQKAYFHLEPDLPIEALENTHKIANQIDLELPLFEKHFPKYPVEEGQTASKLLRDLVFEGLSQRIPDYDGEYKERAEKELAVIDETGFPDYFLIVWDLMRYARKENIYTGPGRGSAAGSLVAYALYITDVDPVEYHLIFERFLNKERLSPPDIDLDFPDNKRGQMISYLRKRYGQSQTAQIITFNRFGARQAIRDTVKVLGLGRAEENAWAKSIPNKPGMTLKEALARSKSFQSKVSQRPDVFDIAQKLEGQPRNSSIHASGIIIHDSDLSGFIPLQKGHDGIQVSQFEMGDLEKVGLIKFDILGLKNLHIIDDALEAIAQDQGKVPDLKSIDLNDQNVLALFRKGETEGIFQFESDGIKRQTQKLQPSEFEDIVAMVSLYRPGPMQQIDHYIRRKAGKEPVSYPHQDLADILDLTYGIIIYQEQIMQIAHKMAGYSLGQADILRRAISKKDHQLIESEGKKFVQASQEKGYTEKTAQQVYGLIERFADYGFNRSHAVAYAMISYQMAYLKTYYPPAFYAALLSNADGQKRQNYYLDMLNKSIRFTNPSINDSLYQHSVKDGRVLPGFIIARYLPHKMLGQMTYRRQEEGAYQSFIDFVKRLDASYHEEKYIQPLIDLGFFDEFGDTRPALKEALPNVLTSLSLSQDNLDLFETVLAPVIHKQADYAIEEKLSLEREASGYYLSLHPNEAHRHLRVKLQIPYILEASQTANEKLQVFGSLHEVKSIKTKNGEKMAFASLTDQSGQVDLVLFPEAYRRFIKHVTEGKDYLVEGKFEKRDGQGQILLDKLEDLVSLEERSQRLFVQLETLNDQSLLNDVLRILQDYPGQNQVYIVAKDSKKALPLKNQYFVKVNNDLLEALEALVGQKNVAVN